MHDTNRVFNELNSVSCKNACFPRNAIRAALLYSEFMSRVQGLGEFESYAIWVPRLILFLNVLLLSFALKHYLNVYVELLSFNNCIFFSLS